MGDAIQSIQLLPAHPVTPVPLRLVRTSSTKQPRDGSPIDTSDLEPSMRDPKVGLIHPIWVRTRRLEPPDRELGDTIYEIITGERRTLAATRIGWSTIDAVIRDDLTELEIFLIQLDENERRRALTPTEQADAVARLMAPKADGGFGLDDTAEVATRLGISVQTVYQRLALSKTTLKVRAALETGRLYLGAAIALASISDPAAQDEALAECPPEDDGAPAHVRRVQNLVRDKYHLRLAPGAAPFPTALDGLVAGVPACSACPKTTGQDRQRWLFPEAATVSSEERCTDRACYGAKKKAWAEREVSSAKEKGLRVVEPPEGAQFYPAGHLIGSRAPGLVDLDERPAGQAKTYRELGFAEVSVVVVDGDHRVHYLGDRTKARAAIGDAGAGAAPQGQDVTPPVLRGDPAAPPDHAPAPAAPTSKSDQGFALERRAEEAAGLQALEAIAARAERRKVGAPFWAFLLRGVIALVPNRLEHVVERRELRPAPGRGKADRELVTDLIGDLDEDELRGLLVEILAGVDGLHPAADDNHALAVATRFYGVDLDELVEQHTKRLKAEAKAAAKTAAKDKPKPTTAPAAAPPAASAVPEKGKCSACGCTDAAGCKDGCCWADTEETLCSICAEIQAICVELIEDLERAPNLEELCALVSDRHDHEDIGDDRVRACVADAVRRKKILPADAHGRFNKPKGARVVQKPENAGATPLPEEVPVRSRIVAFLRGQPELTAQRRQLLDHLRGVDAGLTPSVVLREVALMTNDGLLAPNAGATDPLRLTAPTWDEAMEQVEGLAPAALKARWTEVMRTQPPSSNVHYLRSRLAARLSGEYRPDPNAPKPPPAARAAGAGKA